MNTVFQTKRESLNEYHAFWSAIQSTTPPNLPVQNIS